MGFCKGKTKKGDFILSDKGSENIGGYDVYCDGSGELIRKSGTSFLLIVLCVLTLVIAVLTILNTFVFMRFVVSGDSMKNTLHDGDVLIANMVKTPTYGDVILIDGEYGNERLVKRAIAFGGDRVATEGGYVYLKKAGQTEFVKLDESAYVYEDGKTFYPDKNNHTHVLRNEWLVPEGEIFYLGDNREHSSDSRYGGFGTCSTAQVIGVYETWSAHFIWYNKFILELFGNGN